MPSQFVGLLVFGFVWSVVDMAVVVVMAVVVIFEEARPCFYTADAHRVTRSDIQQTAPQDQHPDVQEADGGGTVTPAGKSKFSTAFLLKIF